MSWKKSKDALTYNLFYKESSAGEYQKVSEISDTGYVLDGLKDLTEYTVYVTAVNELGESGPSLAAAAVTTDANPAVMPKYNLINVGEAGQAGAHIIDAKMWGTMQDSPLDTQAGTAWGTVDHDAVSCYVKGSWDDGGYNPVHAPLNSTNGLYYEFDKAYKIDTIAFHDVTSRDTGLFYAKARYWDESGNAVDLSGLSMGQRKDADGRIYYVLKLAEPVEAKKFQFGLARYQKGGNITVSEVYFYYYDTLMDEIMSLYAHGAEAGCDTGGHRCPAGKDQHHRPRQRGVSSGSCAAGERAADCGGHSERYGLEWDGEDSQRNYHQ